MSSVSRPVVCGFDGSEHAQRALGVATELAVALDAPLVLVNAFHVPPALEGLASQLATGDSYQKRVTKPLAAASESLLRDAAAGLPEGVSSVLVPRAGWPGDVIVETADAVDARWVVVGTRGRSTAGRLMLGSIAAYVVRHAGRTVTVVP